VISKVVTLAANIESQLIELLLLTAPQPQDTPVKPAVVVASVVLTEPILQGPVVNPEGNPDVVKGQSEVDDLLASLGF
jgi:chemotaxis protein CheZ